MVLVIVAYEVVNITGDWYQKNQKILKIQDSS